MPNIKCFIVKSVNTETGKVYGIGEYIGSDDRDKVAFRRVDNGEDLKVNSFYSCPPGAMMRTWYYEDNFKGLDGECWSVITPGGMWIIDSRCSNCTKPNDNIHKCWCRKGVAPNFTVDKNGPHTCSAGAGSIQIGKYHGFLRNGFLVDA